MTHYFGRAGGLLVIAALALTACTSAPSKDPSGSGPPTSPSAPTGPNSASAPTPPGSTTPSTPVSSPSATGSATSTALPRDYCSASALSVRAVNGSGGGGKQYAVILFTNNGAAACSLVGYPGVSLLAGGRSLATAGRTGVAAAPVRLSPGGKAQAAVVDSSTCQAALSDTLRVYPPSLSVYFESPIQLRGCALSVGPVQSA